MSARKLSSGLTRALSDGSGAGQQPVVGPLQLRVTQEDQVGKLLGQGPRRADQAHPGLAQQAVPLSSVATATSDDLVFPAATGATPRGGDDVVDRELGGGHRLPAVLAAVVVP